MTDRAQSLPHVLRLLLGLVVLSTVMGVVFAALAMPAVGAAGQAAKGGVKAFNDLPSEFNATPLAQQSRILDAKGGLIANPYDEFRIVVPLEQISPWMQKAQIAIEDSRFYSHHGLDPRGFSRAFVSNLGGGGTQGASTLTQQYVKITLQENALKRDDKEAAAEATEKSYQRKLQELKYAIDVEKKLTKQQILAGYLNLVYYGDQAHGVEAAAQNYFKTKASKLTLGQSALLAGIVQQPTAFNPVEHPDAAQARRDLVLDRMQVVGFATADEIKAAKAVPVKKMLKRTAKKGVCQRSKEPYVCAYVMEYLQKSPRMAALGKTPAERLKNINQGGLTIQTTIDPDLQKQAFKEITKAVPVNNDNNLGAASTTIEPGTGKVIAMVQASDFNKSQVNLNVDEMYGGGPDGYQIGSTAKAFILVTALEKGLPMTATISAPPSPHTFPPGIYKDECSTGSPWRVQGGGKGSMSLASALGNSVNTAFAQLAIDVGGCSVRNTMTKMGMHQSSGKPIPPLIAAIALGAGTATPMTLASSYATIAARGKYCEPTPIHSVKTPAAKSLKMAANPCRQVIRKEVADGAAELLQGSLKFGTATNANWNVYARPAAGKTGTTEKNNQSWYVGFTPQRSISVWIGNVKIADSNGRLRTLNGKCFGVYGCPGQVFGGTISAPVWAKIMRAAVEDLPVERFHEPTSEIRYGSGSVGFERTRPPVILRPRATVSVAPRTRTTRTITRAPSQNATPKASVSVTPPKQQTATPKPSKVTITKIKPTG